MSDPNLRRAMLRAWWLMHGEAMGLPLLAVGLFALAVLAGFALVPTGPATTVTGAVVGFGVSESERGTQTRIQVRLGEVILGLRPSPATPCRVGDLVDLQRTPRLWGPTFRAGRCRPA